MSKDFKRVFFKYYDKKTLSGQVSFLKADFNKAEFIAMCNGEEIELTREKVLDYAAKLKLDREETAELLEAAGIENRENINEDIL